MKLLKIGLIIVMMSFTALFACTEQEGTVGEMGEEEAQEETALGEEEGEARGYSGNEQNEVFEEEREGGVVEE
jgi:hypothetical protein